MLRLLPCPREELEEWERLMRGFPERQRRREEAKRKKEEKERKEREEKEEKERIEKERFQKETALRARGHLVEMGFDEDAATAALVMSGGRLDMAVRYLSASASASAGAGAGAGAVALRPGEDRDERSGMAEHRGDGRPRANPASVATLTAMGFDETAATAALLRCGGRVGDAAAFLLDQQ